MRCFIGRQQPAAIFTLFQRLGHLPIMKDRLERRDLFHQPVGQFLSGTNRQRRNVIDRLFRIQLSALAAGLVQNIDKVTAQVQKSQFEHRKQAARAGTDDDDVGLLDISHDSVAVRSRGGSGAGAADHSRIYAPGKLKQRELPTDIATYVPRDKGLARRVAACGCCQNALHRWW